MASVRREDARSRRTVRVSLLQCFAHADVAQLVEHHLAKVRVAGSSPVVRSKKYEVRGDI